MKLKLTALIMALAMGLSLAACSGNGGGTASTPPPATGAPATGVPAAGDDWSYIQGKGEMIIGYTVFEPMNYTDGDGKFVGFETEFAEAVCAKLGVKPVFQEINWDTKVLELESKNIDCIWNGMTITPALQENIGISQPYIKNMQVVVIQTDNQGKYTDAASLATATVAAEVGSAGEQAIQGDENLSKATYVGMAKQTETLLEVKSGASDAAVLDYVLAGATIGEGTNYADLMMIPGLELSVEEYGIGLRKDSTAVDKVNEAMDALIADGTLGAIAEKYGLGAQLLANQ